MKLAMMALLILVAAPAGAATMTLSATAPSFEADSICNPTSFAQAGPLKARWSWGGRSVGADSTVGVAPGAQVVKQVQVPAGNYTAQLVWVDAAGNQACPLTASGIVKGRPGQGSFQLGWIPETRAELPRYLAGLLELQRTGRPPRDQLAAR